MTPSAGSAAVSWSSKDHGMKEGTGAGISVTSVQMGKKYQVKREGKSSWESAAGKGMTVSVNII